MRLMHMSFRRQVATERWVRYSLRALRTDSTGVVIQPQPLKIVAHVYVSVWSARARVVR